MSNTFLAAAAQRARDANSSAHQLLLAASKAGDLSAVQQLLDGEAAGVNAQDAKGFTPAQLAAARGHAEVVSALLARPGVLVDLPSSTGATPLIAAAGNGHLEVLQLLLDDGRADPAVVGLRGRGALHGAALYGHLAIVRALLRDRRVPVDPPDETGRTPAADAAHKGRTAILRALLDAGAREPPPPLEPAAPSSPPADPPREGGALLTVIVITSPAPCHPSTEMIERLLLSLRLLAGLEATAGASGAVPVLISCDGYEVGSKKKKTAAVGEERAADYEEYKARLLRSYGAVCEECGCTCTCGKRPRVPGAWLDVQVNELQSWHGFGLGLRAALRLARTPLVLVSPHDMEFTSAADLRRIVALVRDAANGVEYVGFPNANNLSHAQRMQARGVQVAPVRIDGCRLLPLCQWKENPHVCSVAHYERCVFGPTAWPKIKKGHFIEDTVGQRQRNLIAEHGLEAHRDWGTFLLWPQAEGAAEGDPGSFAMTHHLDGIGYKTVAERARLGLTVFDGEAAKVEAASALG